MAILKSLCRALRILRRFSVRDVYRVLPVAFSVMLLLLTVDAPKALAKNAPLLGISVADLRPDLFSGIAGGFSTDASAAHIGILAADAHGEVATQIRQIRGLINRHIKALIYVPAGVKLSGVPVEDAKKAGIPVVAVYGNPISEPADTFIGTDNVSATKSLVQYMCKLSRGKGKVAVIEGIRAMAPRIERASGFAEGLKRCPRLSVVASRSAAAWSEEQGYSIAREMLRERPDIDVIFGQADVLALGAARAARSAKMVRSISIFGFDGDEAGLVAVQRGVLAATMVHRSRYMGRLAFNSALRLASGKALPRVQMLDAVLATKSNVASLLENRP